MSYTRDAAHAQACAAQAARFLAHAEMAQLTLDGRAVPLPPLEPSTRGIVQPEPLFAQTPFTHRVPGTLSMGDDAS